MTEPYPTETLFERVMQAEPPDGVVTVAVSLYNYGRYLRECLDSVHAQLHAPLDLVVVDDASTQDSAVAVALDWLSEHGDRFARATLLRHRRNQGLAAARNTGFWHARGEQVFVLDADNSLYPRAIRKLHTVMRANALDAAYTQLEYFGAERRLGFADMWQRDWLANGNYVDAMALISRRAWQDVGGYTHIEGGWEDYDFWCKFAEQKLVAAYVPEILCRYRVHPASMLRTETISGERQIAVQLAMRHPWLRLG